MFSVSKLINLRSSSPSFESFIWENKSVIILLIVGFVIGFAVGFVIWLDEGFVVIFFVVLRLVFLNNWSIFGQFLIAKFYFIIFGLVGFGGYIFNFFALLISV